MLDTPFLHKSQPDEMGSICVLYKLPVSLDYKPCYTLLPVTILSQGFLDGLKNFLSKEFSLTPQMARR